MTAEEPCSPPDDLPQLLHEAMGRTVTVCDVELCKCWPKKRRAVFKVTVEDGEARQEVGLKFRDRKLAEVYRNWELVASRAHGFRVPRPLALLEHRDCIVYEWSPGADLGAVLGSSDGYRWAHAAGATISSLHGMNASFERTTDVTSNLRMLARWVTEAQETGHPWSSRLKRSLDELTRDAPPDHEPVSPGHRDFYHSNLLATDPPTLIDLDALSMCDPAMDAGNFSAHLIVEGLPWLVEPFLDAALGGEARMRARENFHRRATLTRLSAAYWVRGKRAEALSVPFA